MSTSLWAALGCQAKLDYLTYKIHSFESDKGSLLSTRGAAVRVKEIHQYTKHSGTFLDHQLSHAMLVHFVVVLYGTGPGLKLSMPVCFKQDNHTASILLSKGLCSECHRWCESKSARCVMLPDMFAGSVVIAIIIRQTVFAKGRPLHPSSFPSFPSLTPH